MHTGALRPRELHCPAEAYRLGYVEGYIDAYPFLVNSEEDDDQEPDYYEVYE